MIRNEAHLNVLKVCPESLISKLRVGKWKLAEFNDNFDINFPSTLQDVGAASDQEGFAP